MKHLIPILLLYTYTFNLHLLSAAVPLRWTVETSRAQPATFEAYQGETLDFEATLQSYGKPLEAPVQYAFYWQTNGMGNAWWSVPVQSSSSSAGTGTSHSNCMHATWLPAYDVGAKAYNCFIGLSNSIYHAAFQLRLRPSPGAVPNELPLPQKVIDFSKVTVINPPWSGGGSGGVDTNAVIDIANATIATNPAISTLTSDVSRLESNKLDKTGGEITGEVDFQDTIYTRVINADALHVDNLHSYYSADFTGPLTIDGDADNNVYTKTQTDELVAQKADEFTEWDGVPNGYSIKDSGLPPDSPRWAIVNDETGVHEGMPKGDLNSTSLTWTEDQTAGDLSYFAPFTATRKHVLRTGDAATPQQVTDAISTNNPAFVSAVQSIAPPPSPTLRLYDEVRGCWWIGRMVNGVISWEVED